MAVLGAGSPLRVRARRLAAPQAASKPQRPPRAPSASAGQGWARLRGVLGLHQLRGRQRGQSSLGTCGFAPHFHLPLGAAPAHPGPVRRSPYTCPHLSPLGAQHPLPIVTCRQFQGCHPDLAHPSPLSGPEPRAVLGPEMGILDKGASGGGGWCSSSFPAVTKAKQPESVSVSVPVSVPIPRAGSAPSPQHLGHPEVLAGPCSGAVWVAPGRWL